MQLCAYIGLTLPQLINNFSLVTYKSHDPEDSLTEHKFSVRQSADKSEIIFKILFLVSVIHLVKQSFQLNTAMSIQEYLASNLNLVNQFYGRDSV